MSKAQWLALSSIPGVGGATVRKLIDRFGSVDAVFDASDDDLLTVPRITDATLSQLRAVDLNSVESELLDLADEGITAMTWDDPGYPVNLLLIRGAPPVLFIHGILETADEKAVAIVGTRKPSPQATIFAETLGEELAKRGLTVVSGLALGIDSAAHQGALRSAAGRTLAVLGSGLRAIHPRVNIPLAVEIMTRGAVISELLPNTPVRGPNLMARDRLISGLSLAVIVIEADTNSGSLDTASKAKRQGRKLLAVPGSHGTDTLLEEGAESITPGDIDFDELCHQISTHIVGGDGGRQLSLL